MRRRLAHLAGMVLVVLAASAHVGSNDTFFEGAAGPYRIRVIVRLPGVVPGLAQITVRVPPDAGVRRVTVLPVHWDAGTGGAPPPDVAQPVPGDPAFYSAALWLMTFGSYSVNVTVEGDAGRGTAVVPVLAVATRRLAMQRPLGWALAALGALLLVGAVTIVRAAVREAVLDPGAAPDRRRERRARFASGAALILLLACTGVGAAWWDDVDAAYRRHLFRPFAAAASVRIEDGRRVLRVAIDDSVWLRRGVTPLVPDHGKLMHLFLVRDAHDAFAHLHPLALDSNTFETPLPPLPPGSYRMYADITHESGFAQTLTDTVVVPPARQPDSTPDPDDGWWTDRRALFAGTPHRLADTLADGSVMTWERGGGPIVAGDEAPLVFSVRDATGHPARLEPYMGMAAHAAVTRDDGAVFAHLHPLGTISWAAQQTFVLRTAADSVPGTLARKLEHTAAHRADPHPIAATLSFPYAFPRTGTYHVWVQVKRRGRVLTGHFVAAVEAPECKHAPGPHEPSWPHGWSPHPPGRARSTPRPPRIRPSHPRVVRS